MRNNQAYTIIEALLVILMLPMIFSLSFATLKFLYQYNYELTSRQNFIGIIQLRKRIATGSDIVIKGDSLVMVYNNQTVELICQDDRLNQVDGYMEYLFDLQDCEWKTEGSLIYLLYIYKELSYEIFVGFLK